MIYITDQNSNAMADDILFKFLDEIVKEETTCEKPTKKTKMADDTLFKFLDEIEEKETTSEKKTKPKRKRKVTFKPEIEEQKVEKEEGKQITNIWSGVEAVLNNWFQQLLYIESVFKTSKSLQLQINEALERMKIDGLLSSNEFDELTKVGKLWHELIELSYCYHTGSGSSKKRIIELLLELYSLKQITKEVFVNTCIQL